MNDLLVSVASRSLEAFSSHQLFRQCTQDDAGDVLMRQFRDSVRAYAKLTPREIGSGADAICYCEREDFNKWRDELAVQPRSVRERVLREVSGKIDTPTPSMRSLRAIGIADEARRTSEATKALVGENRMTVLGSLRDDASGFDDAALRRYVKKRHDVLFARVALLAADLRGEHAALSHRLVGHVATLVSRSQRMRLSAQVRAPEGVRPG